ncbi:integrase, catalytic region, zinc finger, CCHC-type containing protein, partial [Tanacetum coccineum]
QYEKLIITSRAKKAAKTHDSLALVAHTSSSSSRSPPSYYVTHPPFVVDHDDDYQGDTFSDDKEDSITSTMMFLACTFTQCYSTPTNNRLCTSSNIRNQAVVQADRVNIQSRNVGNGGNATNVQCYNCNAKGHYARDCPKPRVWDSKYFMKQMLLATKDEVGVILFNEHNDFILTDGAQMEEFEELSANIYMMAIIQQANVNSNEGPSYDSAFICEVQKPSISFMNLLFSKKINDGKVEHDKNAHDHHDNELELLAKNAYKEAGKQLILAKKVKQQNVELTKQIEQYKEKLKNQFQTQFIHDMDKVRALEKERDDLQISVSNERNQLFELKNAHTSLKHKFNTIEDKYLDDILKLEAKVKKNENVVVKMSNSIQAMFMLGPKALSVYDPQLKHGLVYENPYTLKHVIFENSKLYDASYFHSLNVGANVRDSEEILKDAIKSQFKMKNKLKDPIEKRRDRRERDSSLETRSKNVVIKRFRERKLSENFMLRGVLSWLDEVSLVDGVFDGAFRGVKDEEVVVGEGVVSHGRKKVESMVERFEEDEDEKKNGKDGSK